MHLRATCLTSTSSVHSRPFLFLLFYPGAIWVGAGSHGQRRTSAVVDRTAIVDRPYKWVLTSVQGGAFELAVSFSASCSMSNSAGDSCKPLIGEL